uniref:Uncharacterized protein n=1 Tax=Chromera velia CCMP2878 TaxID=1169474 RepID=A0A0G4FH47_9ALVE|eukprot:Cvel_16986.t1-p1 / transcript=Cvel_16986.t1 / gene=Cvel_16986 / organism=Chromera_velia_CCMP2878 / gene_product=hypothetical protein / transcript_product=hypothetical protein / location=Cvel_scaffold1334:18022-19461(-) / protein_length=480 / sequence_SO=supercontig / SO=protein_coding / is_pseudo=false
MEADTSSSTSSTASLPSRWKIPCRLFNFPLTYVWLVLAFVAYVAENPDLEGIAVVLTVKLNLSWYATRAVHPDIFDRLLQFWLRFTYSGKRKEDIPKERVRPPWESFWRLFLSCGDHAIHSLPGIVHLYMRLDRWKWYHVPLEYIFVSRLYCWNLEGTLFCSGRQLNALYSVVLEADVFNTFYTCEQLCLFGSLIYSMKDIPTDILPFGAYVKMGIFLFSLTGYLFLCALSLFLFTHQSSCPSVHARGLALCQRTGIEWFFEKMMGLKMKQQRDAKVFRAALSHLKETRQKQKKRQLRKKHQERKREEKEREIQETEWMSEMPISLSDTPKTNRSRDRKFPPLNVTHMASADTIATESPPSPTASTPCPPLSPRSPPSPATSFAFPPPPETASPCPRTQEECRAKIVQEELQVLQDAQTLRGGGMWAFARLPAPLVDPARQSLVRERAEFLRKLRGKGWKEYALCVNPKVGEKWLLPGQA